MKKQKSLTPEERLNAITKNISAGMSDERRIQILVAIENLKMEFPEWTKENGLDKPDEFDNWEEIVQPETLEELYYGIYYYSGLKEYFKVTPGNPEKYLTNGQVLKLVSKYISGKKKSI